MHGQQLWHDVGRSTHLLCSITLSICFLWLNLVVNVYGEQSSTGAGTATGFLIQEGNFMTPNINCSGSGLILDNDILSVASWLPGDYYLEQADTSGRCYFSESLAQLLDSFSTEFAFILAPFNVSEETIDGIAFIIFQDPYSIGCCAGTLGILQPPGIINNTMFAVEFDAFTNPEFNDPPYQHVGVDLGSVNSTVTARAGYYEATTLCSDNTTFIPLNLTGEGRIQAWIDYNGTAQELSIFMSSQLGAKPPRPLLTFEVNLSAIFQNKTEIYFGLSSSTGLEYAGWAYVLGWSLNILGAASPLYPSPIEYCPGAPEKLDLGLVLGVSIPTTILVIMVGVLLGGWYLLRVRNSLRRQFQLVELENLDYRPKQYSYKELSKATKCFSPELELGRGGFGVVYRGTIASSTGSSAIAVKKIIPRSNSVQTQQEYVSEMRVIGRLRHRNLVQLLGWCHEKKGELMQVYEYLPNGSLDKLLFNRTPGDGLIILTWDQRLHIITGVAAALVYLHEEWKQLIVHRDVKVSNVMLDSDFNARLGDFGLARLYEHSQIPDLTRVAGTVGYMAPELTNGEFTEKSDVFSFGIVTLEVATGRRSIDFKRPPGEEHLVKWVLTLNEKGRFLDAADVGLDGNFRLDELLRVLHVGLLCSRQDPAERPTMRQALEMLNGESPLKTLTSARLKTGFKFHLGRVRTDSGTDWDRSTTDIEDSEAPIFVDYGGRRFHHSSSFSGSNFDSEISGRT